MKISLKRVRALAAERVLLRVADVDVSMVELGHKLIMPADERVMDGILHVAVGELLTIIGHYVAEISHTPTALSLKLALPPRINHKNVESMLPTLAEEWLAARCEEEWLKLHHLPALSPSSESIRLLLTPRPIASPRRY